MRNLSLMLFSITALPLFSSSLRAGEYLNDKGQLTQALKITQLQGGFAGFTGVQYTVSPNGEWSWATVFNRKITPKGKGMLSEKELKKLAGILEKYNFAKLPAKTGVRPGANPHSIEFMFGKKKATIVGMTPPKPNAKDPTASVESRFAGLWKEVKAMLTVKPE